MRKIQPINRKYDPTGKIQQLIERVELLTGIKGKDGIVVKVLPTGITIRSSKRAGGTEIRSAFCKTAASSGTEIVCYLDVDGSGEEITVQCVIAGGSDLNTAIPRLTDGLEIPVWQIDGIWKTQTFQATTECE